jgi:hypothetical protein
MRVEERQDGRKETSILNLCARRISQRVTSVKGATHDVEKHEQWAVHLNDSGRVVLAPAQSYGTSP